MSDFLPPPLGEGGWGVGEIQKSDMGPLTEGNKH